MAYTESQLDTARTIIAVGRSMGASRRVIKSALMTALMESSLNPRAKNQYGFVGWRQEHPIYYGKYDRTNPRGQARRYFREARGVTGSAAQIAAKVQRPEPSARGKYAQYGGQAGALLRQLGGAGGGSSLSSDGGSGGRAPQVAQYKVVKGREKTDVDAALIDALLSGRKNPVTTALAAVDAGLYTSQTEDRLVRRKQAQVEVGLPGAEGGAKLAPGADRKGQKTNPNVLRFVGQIAGIFGSDLTITTGTNHRRMTVNGKVSDHWDGNAADIPATGRRLIRLGQAALIAAGMDPARARKQKGGLYNVGGHQIIFNTHIGGNHTNHLHVSAR